MSITMEVAKRAAGQEILSYGVLDDNVAKISVALWHAGNKKFLLLKRARTFVGFEELPGHTTMSQAVDLQELKLVSMQGGKA